MSRGRKRILFIGATERGKSSRIREIINERKEPVMIHNQSQQVAYRDFTPISLEQFSLMKSGKYQTHEPDYLKFYKTAFNHFRNGLVIGEDASEYLTQVKNMTLYPLLIGLRHKGIDVILVFHSLAETPRYVIRQANEVILFKTGDTWNDCKDRIPEQHEEIVKKAFDRVNNHPNQYHWERIILMKTGTL